MSREVTHRWDDEQGRMVQLVSAARLREIIGEDGDDLGKPSAFGPRDEWFVEFDDEG